MCIRDRSTISSRCCGSNDDDEEEEEDAATDDTQLDSGFHALRRVVTLQVLDHLVAVDSVSSPSPLLANADVERDLGAARLLLVRAAVGA